MYFPSHANIPRKAISWQFDQARGPGGQHVNKVAVAVNLRVSIDELYVKPEVRKRLLVLAPTRNLERRELVIRASNHRSQWQNRIDAWERLLKLLETAKQIQKPRIRTTPTSSSKHRWRKRKSRQKQRKANRRKPLFE